MYPVSDAFLQAVQGNTRKYYWTGKITTAGGVEYPFDQEDIVKGSGYITAQCCGNSEIELGAVYAAEMGISLFLDIDRYTLEDAEVEAAPMRPLLVRSAPKLPDAIPGKKHRAPKPRTNPHLNPLKKIETSLTED